MQLAIRVPTQWLTQNQKGEGTELMGKGSMESGSP